MNALSDINNELEILYQQRNKINADIERLLGAKAYYEEKNSKISFIGSLTNNKVLKQPIVISDTLRSMVRKVVEEQLDGFETSDHITNILLGTHYKHKVTDLDKQKFKTQVSNLLSGWKKGKYGKSLVTSYQYSSSKKDTVWGRKDWLNEENKPKAGFFIHIRVNETQSSVTF